MKELLTASGCVVKPIGLGTFSLEGHAMEEMVLKAFQIGYCLIDTADDYRGETGIGLAVSRLEEIGLNREDVFLQTKISDNAAHDDEPLQGVYFNRYSDFMRRHSVEDLVREKVNISIRELNTDYLDSLLMHWPYEYYLLDIWEAMIKLQEEGKIRYIGVSNFHERHIEELRKTGVMPAINEIYISPIGTKQSDFDFSNANDIILMTYSPLMDLVCHRLPLNEINQIAAKYHKSAAQVILRWNIERGCYPLPRTKKIKRLQENFEVFDFQLAPEEVAVISSLNRDYQFLPESKICPGI